MKQILKCYIFLSIIFLTSCEKLVSIDPPANQAIAKTVFNNEQTAESAITGLYSSMSIATTSLSTTAITRLCGLSADEIENNASIQFDEFYQNAISSANSTVSGSLWTSAYNFIYQANAIVEGLNASQNMSTESVNQIMGEALFLRAFNYFYLVNIFGDVPLVLETDYTKTTQLPRTPTAQVYAQIIADLKSAQNLLKPQYPSSTKARANAHAATALLARVYLYTQMWSEAETEATMVIESGAYSLPAVNIVFLSNSAEAIWQLIPLPATANTAIAGIFIPATATAIPTHPVTTSLVTSFEGNDLRKTNWLAQRIVSEKTYYYPNKYKVRTGTNVPVTEYLVMMRLAEVYLIRAEARAMQEKLSLAIGDVDSVRKRAGLAVLGLIGKDQLKAAIQKERRAELMCEWGHRWFDLKRTETINNVLNEAKPGWTPTAALYPIPLNQIMINGKLTQNSGYN